MKTLTLLVALVLVLVSTVDACTSVKFPNGTSITFNAQAMTGYWPNLQQSGDVTGNYAWSVSLCDPNAHATGAMGCATGNYMAQNPDCSFTFSKPPTPGALADGTGASFTFADEVVGTNTWSADVTCVCDPSRPTLYLPSGDYKASLSGETGNIIKLTWNFQAKGCCVGGGGGDDGGDKSKGGITWGGVFLILFFVPLGLYVIGFVAWNYKQGKTGADLAPHPEFWKSLPSLAKDGITFIWSKIRGTSWSPSEGASATPGSSGEAGGYTSV